jgi:hypothetical protein
MPKVPSKGIQVVEYPNYHRYKIDGQWAVGVTTALNGIPKDGLKYWAAGEVADYALKNIHQVKNVLDTAGYWPARKMLTEVPNQKKSDAAVRGTDVHALAEKYIRDEEIEVSDELMPYVLGYAAYISDYEPVSVFEELVVANRAHLYAGRLDSIQDIPKLGRCLIEYKSGNKVFGEHALQCAAYRHAETYKDGEGEQPMVKVDAVYILHIQPGTYDLRPAQADEEAFRKFLVALENYRENVQSNKLDKLLGLPLDPPERAA